MENICYFAVALSEREKFCIEKLHLFIYIIYLIKLLNHM